jgi:hypothetical protein
LALSLRVHEQARRQIEAVEMARKKVSTTIYITPEQADRLKLLHERTKVPIAVYIREGIDMVLDKYQHEMPGQLTLDARPVPKK